MKNAVILSCFDWYKARQELIREYMIKKGYRVQVLISDFDHLQKKKLEIKYPECTYVHVPKYKRNLSIMRIISHLIYGYKAKRFLKQTKPDLIYVQIPPNNVSYICVQYKRKHPNIKLVVDIVDLWPESMPIGKVKKSFLGHIWAGMRNKCIKNADRVITECDLYHETLAPITKGKEIFTLYLFKNQTCKDKTQINRIIESISDQRNIVKLAYLGSMNNLIDIDKIVSIIKAIIETGADVELYAIGDGSSRKEFETSVNATGCKSHFYGLVFEEQRKIDLIAHCDYALNIMKPTVKVGLTIKSIDYFSYGLPLLNNIQGDTWEIISTNNLGINVGDNWVYDGKIMSKNVHKVIQDYFCENFSREAFIDRIQSVLEDVI